MNKYSVTGYLKQNDPVLVEILEKLLNETNLNRSKPPAAKEKNAANAATERLTGLLKAANQISTLYDLGESYGSVGINTFSYLARKYRYVFAENGNGLKSPAWLIKLSLSENADSLSEKNFDAGAFLQLYKENFKTYIPKGAAWEANFTRFLGFIFADPGILSRRWAAYLLATAMHEGRSAASKWKATWNPVKETGGEGKSYGGLEVVTNWKNQPIGVDGNVIDKDHPGKTIQQRYYGRGYVQITHQENYRAMDDALGLEGRLHKDPDLALRDAKVSYDILSYGMVNGSFRGRKLRNDERGYYGGHKLEDYLNASVTDYVSARDIVNGGRDKAQLIAHYAATFKNMFDAAL